MSVADRLEAVVVSSASQETKGKKTVAGEVPAELYQKLDRIARHLQRTKSDLVGTIVSNWLVAADEKEFQSHAGFTTRMGLMPLDAVAAHEKRGVVENIGAMALLHVVQKQIKAKKKK